VTFDIYVINLHEASVRRERMLHELNALGFDDVSFIEAVNGREIPSSLRDSLYDDHKSITKYGRSLTAGELGCALSHLKTYQTFLKSPNRFALVFEDDAVMAPSFKDVITCSEMERWLDVPNPRVLLLTPLRSFLKRGQQGFFRQYKLVKVRRAWGGYGYVVNRAAAEIMTKINSPCWLSADDWVTYRKVGVIDVRGVEPFCVRHLEDAGSHLEKERRIVETQVPKTRIWARRSQKWLRQFIDYVYYRPFWGLERQKTDKDW